MLQVDLAIVGGGLVGSSLALALSSHPLARGLTVALIDPYPASSTQWAPLSLRTSTIAPSSKAFLEEIGAWNYIPEDRIAPFDQMFVWDHPLPLPVGEKSMKAPPGTMLFRASDIDEEVMGFVVENETLRSAIYRRLDRLRLDGSDLHVIRESVNSIDWGDTDVPNEQATGGEDVIPWPIVHLSGGEKLQCRLIAACDGSRSKLRTLAGGDWFSKGYSQSAVVANVMLKDQITTAYQRFVSTGPVAILPVCSDQTAVPIGNVIWSTTKAEAQALANADDEEFVNELNIVLSENEETGIVDNTVDVIEGNQKRTDGGAKNVFMWDMISRGLEVALPSLGLSKHHMYDEVLTPPECTKVLGKRGSFPLSIGHAPRYVLEEKRTVLVGDAAHNVHPLAGQGVNLGFADVESLVGCIASAAGTGRDIGGESGAPLMKYQRERMVANVGMMSLLHGLQGVFSLNDRRRLRDVRRVGMSMMNAASPVKKLILRAMR